MVILLIFTNFTFTLKLFYIPNIFKLNSLKNIPKIKALVFYLEPKQPPKSPLRLVNMNNTSPIRVTAAAGTNLAGTFSKFTIIIFNLKQTVYEITKFLHPKQRLAGSYIIYIVQDSLLLPRNVRVTHF